MKYWKLIKPLIARILYVATEDFAPEQINLFWNQNIWKIFCDLTSICDSSTLASFL